MRLFFSLVFITLFQIGALRAEVGLYSFGQDKCEAALAGEIVGLEAEGIAEEIAQTGAERDVICSCVGENFVEFDAEYGADLAAGEELSEALGQTIAHCIEAIDDESYSDSATAAEAAFLPDDAAQCRNFLSGAREIAGFSPSDALARLEGAEQNTEDLCRCAAQYLYSISDQFTSQEAQPLVPGESDARYETALGGAMESCIGG